MLPAALLAVALAAPPPPRISPQDEAEAQRLARRSALEYDLGHLDTALHDIERAYLLDPLPGLLFNLGQCHRALRHWEQAERTYRAYLRYRPDAANRATVLTLIDDVQHEQVAASLPEASPAPAPPPILPEEHLDRSSPLPPPDQIQTQRTQASPPAPPATRSAPPAAVEASAQSEAEPTKAASTAWPWVFAGGALVAAGFSIAGFVQMANYGSLKAQSQTQPVSEAAALGAESAYAWGEPLGIVGAALAAACVGGLVWTW